MAKKRKIIFHEQEDCTPSQRRIMDYMHKSLDTAGKKILHVGVGNSAIAKEFRNAFVDGIAYYPGEIEAADKLQIEHYRVFEMNKYGPEFHKFEGRYDFIVDNAVQSYASGFEAVMNLLDRYYVLLADTGLLITERESLFYVRKGCPALCVTALRFVAKKFSVSQRRGVIILSKDPRPKSRAYLIVHKATIWLWSIRSFGAISNAKYSVLIMKCLFTGYGLHYGLNRALRCIRDMRNLFSKKGACK